MKGKGCLCCVIKQLHSRAFWRGAVSVRPQSVPAEFAAVIVHRTLAQSSLQQTPCHGLKYGHKTGWVAAGAHHLRGAVGPGAAHVGGLVQAVQEHLGQPCTQPASGALPLHCLAPPGHPPPRAGAAAASNPPQGCCHSTAAEPWPAPPLQPRGHSPRHSPATWHPGQGTLPGSCPPGLATHDGRGGGGSPTSASLARPSEVISTLALLRSKCATLVLRVCRYASAWASPRATCLPLQPPGLVSAWTLALRRLRASALHCALVYTGAVRAEGSRKACTGCCRDAGGFDVRARPPARVRKAAAACLPSCHVQHCWGSEQLQPAGTRRACSPLQQGRRREQCMDKQAGKQLVSA